MLILKKNIFDADVVALNIKFYILNSSKVIHFMSEHFNKLTIHNHFLFQSKFRIMEIFGALGVGSWQMIGDSTCISHHAKVSAFTYFSERNAFFLFSIRTFSPKMFGNVLNPFWRF